jgi:hypothetical protein
MGRKRTSNYTHRLETIPEAFQKTLKITGASETNFMCKHSEGAYTGSFEEESLTKNTEAAWK